MAKAVYCKDAGFSDCAAVMRGDTEEEVIQKAAEHGLGTASKKIASQALRNIAP